LLLVLPPLLTLTALAPFVADAVPPELPDDDADWSVVFVFVFPTSLLVALILLPPLALSHWPVPDPVASEEVVLVGVIVTLLVLLEPRFSVLPLA